MEGSEPTKAAEFETIDPGIEHAQYFQGCGVCGTAFTHVVTGWGDDLEEALADALEQIACGHEGGRIDLDDLEARIRAEGWPNEERLAACSVSAMQAEEAGESDGEDEDSFGSDERHYYFSIRWRM